MRSRRARPEYGDDRNAWQGARSSFDGFPNHTNQSDTTFDRHLEGAMFASLALDLLADTRRERSGVRS